MTKRRIRQMILLSSTVFVTTASTASFAQATARDPDQPVGSQPAQPTTSGPPAAPSPSAEAGDIIVTAQRREQRLQDVPISVTVVTGESIQNSGTTSLLDLATRLPAVHISQGPQSNNIIIRGVGSGLNAGFEQSVGTFVDGVYRARSRLTQSALFDVERVEVLNGPQTTFFGNNTVAGAINVTTKKPSNVFGYEALGLYSPSDGQFIAHGAVTGPLTDTLSFRIAAEYTGMQGYIYNHYLNEDGPHLRDQIVRAALRWEPSTNFRSDLRFDYAHNGDSGTFYAEIRGCPPPAGFPAARGPCAAYIALKGTTNIDNAADFNADVGPSSFYLDMKELEWTNRVDLGPVAINAISSYNDGSTTSFQNATPLPVTGVAGFFYSPFRQIEEYKVYAQELRLESQSTGWFSYVLGAYYSHGNLVSNSFSSLFNSTAPGTAGAPVTGPNTPIGTNRNLYQTDQTRSVFGQVTAEVLPGLHLNAGLRYTSVKKDASRLALVGQGGPTALPQDFIVPDPVTEAKLYTATGLNNNPFTNPDTTYNKLMPSASVQYNVVPTITAYASYTKGFKAGGYSDSNQPAQFNSESVDSYEVGLKGSLFSHKLFFTLDGFLEDFSNLQEAVSFIGPTGVTITTIGNAATSVSKGVEATATLKAARWLSINASGSYVDSHFSSYTNAGCTAAQTVTFGATCVQNLSGRPLPFAPKFSGTFGFTATQSFRDKYQFQIEPNVFYSTSSFLTPVDDPLSVQGSYATLDTRLSFGPSDKHWEIAVIGKNLTNATVISTSQTIGTSPGLSYALLERARSVAFSISIHH